MGELVKKRRKNTEKNTQTHRMNHLQYKPTSDFQHHRWSYFNHTHIHTVHIGLSDVE